jgi:hypothetical protein
MLAVPTARQVRKRGWTPTMASRAPPAADDGLLEAIATELRSFGLNAGPSDPLLRPPAWSAIFVLTTCATVAGSIGEPPDDEQTAKANAGEPKTHDRSQALP